MSSLDRAALIDAARSKGAEEIKYWENTYQKAPIIAPIDGFIIKRAVEPGQTVSASDAILVMADYLIVKGQVDETDLGQIKLRQKASIALDSYPERNFPGIVEHIAYESSVSNNVTMYTVDIVPNSLSNIFRSGMNASIKFEIGYKENIPTLPLNVVKKAKSRSYVFVKDSSIEKGYKPVEVTTGIEDNNNIEVLTGVSLDAEVIVPDRIMTMTLSNIGRAQRPGMGILGSGGGRGR